MAGNDFVKNPGGSGGNPTRPRDFLRTGKAQSMATPEGRDINSSDAAPGAPTAAQEATPGPYSGQDAGVGTIGNAARPYRLGG